MRTSKSRWAAVGAAFAGVCSVLMLVLPARADATITAVGWWSANPQATAPPGGFAIQGAPDGTSTSLAAIRVLVTPEPITRAALVLNEAGGLSNENAALQVCTTADPWQPVERGEITEAPAPDCTKAVPLVRSPTTKSWSADVTGLVQGVSEVSLMVVVPPPSGEAPAPTVTPPPAPPIPPPVPPAVPAPPVAGLPLNLEIQFGPPTLSVDLAFSEATDPETSDTDFSDLSTGSSDGSFIAPTDSSFGGSSFSTFTPSAPTSSFDFQQPAAVAAADPAGLAAATPVPGQGQVIAGDPPRFRVDDGTKRPIPWGRIGLFVIGSAAVAALSTLARSRIRTTTATA